MDAWGDDQEVGDAVVMLADGNGTFTRAMGLESDKSGAGLGTRSQRYAAVIDDGIITTLLVEPTGDLTVSSAESVLAIL
jgi:peroxiredoxin